MADETSLYQLLKHTYECRGSDLHLKVGLPPAIRIDGAITQVDGVRFNRREFEKVIEALLTPAQQDRFKAGGELDFAYALEGVCRFRVNLYRDINGIGAVFRVIPYKVFTFEEIGLPLAAQKLIEQPNGLILITGPTGAGKTSTLASYISYVNAKARRHIITIEDPIEFQFEDQLSIINQRQVGADVPGFYEGLLTVLRQDPDIVVVGEMREPRTIALTLNAAETGKLVLATLHTTSAVQTAERIINVFPENQQRQILHQLSMVLRGVISQTLLPKIGGGRVAAFEVLINTSAVRSLIGEGKIHLIPSFLETGTEYGMQTMDMSMVQLVKNGLVKAEEALAHSPTPANLKKLLQALRDRD
ncbi:MAG: Twitching motility protein PilT [Candidatus Ozemobacter sibiricus]|uniref:Twitching motility protein PilT n=1 Tax=Candidatus Ozemobacter sibiricus TaxID=2268124 RepID=A0A367ZQN1_9BACT|nr:MAG: Twitching motility protein PilT [Candidatus Ozemobacter sibiricus]